MMVTGGFGNSGVPDFLVCYRGRFIGIECKANGGKPTALQTKNLDEIDSAGGVALVIDETNQELIEQTLNAIDISVVLSGKQNEKDYW